MRVIVGLGNPGSRYAGTRHNIGQRIVAQAAAQWSIPLTLTGLAVRGGGEVHGNPVVLALPVTYMNVSGEAVEELVQAYDVQPQDLLVVHDDMDLPVGRLRLRPSGGTGGHNGLRSIMMTLDTDEFARLKIGVGRPESGVDPAEYVLASFFPEEQEALNPVLTQAIDSIECFVRFGVHEAMNQFNRRVSE